MASDDEQQAIEQEFLGSWDRMEWFFDDLINVHGWKSLRMMPALITELRQHGYERKLRAGQSMFYLILSRSRKHGLRLDQPCIRVITEQGDNAPEMIIEYFSGGEENPNLKLETDAQSFTLSAEFRGYLDSLAAHPID